MDLSKCWSALEKWSSLLLHLVFHVSVLNKVEELPTFDIEGEIVLKPGETVSYRQQKRTTQVASSSAMEGTTCRDGYLGRL